MKKKRVFTIILIVVLLISLSPVAVYFGIILANNGIASHVEKELKDYPLPEDTVFLDSVSIAGKLVGNGNGMQYMGSILVVSDLSEEELYAYYSQSFDDIEIRKQETPVIDFLNSQQYRFELYGDSDQHTHYSVTCWGAPKDVGLGEWMTVLLDMDLRGH